MQQLRFHRANGEVVARSADGENFESVLDGSPYCRRTGDIFLFADGAVGRLGGSVVFIKDERQQEREAFWLEGR